MFAGLSIVGGGAAEAEVDARAGTDRAGRADAGETRGSKAHKKDKKAAKRSSKKEKKSKRKHSSHRSSHRSSRSSSRSSSSESDSDSNSESGSGSDRSDDDSDDGDDEEGRGRRRRSRRDRHRHRSRSSSSSHSRSRSRSRSRTYSRAPPRSRSRTPPPPPRDHARSRKDGDDDVLRASTLTLMAHAAASSTSSSASSQQPTQHEHQQALPPPSVPSWRTRVTNVASSPSPSSSADPVATAASTSSAAPTAPTVSSAQLRSEQLARDRLGFRKPDAVGTSAPAAPSASSSASAATTETAPSSSSSWRDRVKAKRSRADGDAGGDGSDDDRASSARRDESETIDRSTNKSSNALAGNRTTRELSNRFAGMSDAAQSESPSHGSASDASTSEPPSAKTSFAFLPVEAAIESEASASASASPAADAAPSAAAATAAPTVTEADLNKLAAQAQRAKLMKKHDLFERLNRQIDELRSSMASTSTSRGQISSTTTATTTTTATANRDNTATTDRVVVLAERDAHGRPLLAQHLHDKQREEQEQIARYGRVLPHADFQADRHQRRKIDKIDERGERTAYFESDVRTTSTSGNGGSNNGSNNNTTSSSRSSPSVQELVAHERTRRRDELDDTHARMIAKKARYAAPTNTEEEFDAMDHDVSMYEGTQHRLSAQQRLERQEHAIQRESLRQDRALNRCLYCTSSDAYAGHLVISAGVRLSLVLPRASWLGHGHCLIVPHEHVAATTEFDENMVEEMQYFRKHLIKMYQSFTPPRVPIFFEIVPSFERSPHTVIHVVPLSVQAYAGAPLVFLKALQEADTEWSQHKKVIHIDERGVRAVVPARFPYFAVEFGKDVRSHQQQQQQQQQEQQRQQQRSYGADAEQEDERRGRYGGGSRRGAGGRSGSAIIDALQDGSRITGGTSSSQQQNQQPRAVLGYVHVIEDESKFTERFGIEMVASMLEQEADAADVEDDELEIMNAALGRSASRMAYELFEEGAGARAPRTSSSTMATATTAAPTSLQAGLHMQHDGQQHVSFLVRARATRSSVAIEQQRVAAFRKCWAAFDWTRRLTVNQSATVTR